VSNDGNCLLLHMARSWPILGVYDVMSRGMSGGFVAGKFSGAG